MYMKLLVSEVADRNRIAASRWTNPTVVIICCSWLVRGDSRANTKVKSEPIYFQQFFYICCFASNKHQNAFTKITCDAFHSVWFLLYRNNKSDWYNKAQSKSAPWFSIITHGNFPHTQKGMIIFKNKIPTFRHVWKRESIHERLLCAHSDKDPAFFFFSFFRMRDNKSVSRRTRRGRDRCCCCWYQRGRRNWNSMISDLWLLCSCYQWPERPIWALFWWLVTIIAESSTRFDRSEPILASLSAQHSPD